MKYWLWFWLLFTWTGLGITFAGWCKNEQILIPLDIYTVIINYVTTYLLVDVYRGWEKDGRV